MKRLKSLKLLFHAFVASFLAPFFILFLILLAYLPIDQPYYHLIVSGLPIVALYFWAIFRPMVLPVTIVFFLGLLSDFIGSGLIGFHAFLYLLIFVAAKSQRKLLRGQGFWGVWAFFMLVICGYHIGGWTLRGLILEHSPPDLRAWLIAVVTTTLIYPIVLPLLIRIDKRIKQSEAQIA